VQLLLLVAETVVVVVGVALVVVVGVALVFVGVAIVVGLHHFDQTDAAAGHTFVVVVVVVVAAAAVDVAVEAFVDGSFSVETHVALALVVLHRFGQTWVVVGRTFVVVEVVVVAVEAPVVDSCFVETHAVPVLVAVAPRRFDQTWVVVGHTFVVAVVAVVVVVVVVVAALVVIQKDCRPFVAAHPLEAHRLAPWQYFVLVPTHFFGPRLLSFFQPGQKMLKTHLLVPLQVRAQLQRLLVVLVPIVEELFVLQEE